VKQFKLLLVCAFIFTFSCAFCQGSHPAYNGCIQASTDTSVYMAVDSMPRFPGGEVAGNKFIDSVRKSLKINPALSGSVTVLFIVQPDGHLTDFRVGDMTFQISEGEKAYINALRIMKVMPPWKPGTCHGRKVPVYDSLTIKFLKD
jgi:hypothetical protein